MTPAKCDELRKLANETTPGPWRREMLELSPGGPMTIGVCSERSPVCIMNGIVESPRGNRDARFIAAANPATVIALLDRIAELERELQAVRVLDAWAMKHAPCSVDADTCPRSTTIELYADNRDYRCLVEYLGATPAQARIAAAEALAKEDPSLLETEFPATLPR